MNKIVYSTSTPPAERTVAQQQLMATIAQIAAKRSAIFAEDARIRSLNSTYEDRDMQPIVPDPAVEALGYIKRFDIEKNKYIFTDSLGKTLRNSNAAFLYTRRGGGGGKRRITKRKTRLQLQLQRGGALCTNPSLCVQTCTIGNPTITSATVGTSRPSTCYPYNTINLAVTQQPCGSIVAYTTVSSTSSCPAYSTSWISSPNINNTEFYTYLSGSVKVCIASVGTLSLPSAVVSTIVTGVPVLPTVPPSVTPFTGLVNTTQLPPTVISKVTTTGFTLTWSGTQNATSYSFTYFGGTLTPDTPPVPPTTATGSTSAIFSGLTPGLFINMLTIIATGCGIPLSFNPTIGNPSLGGGKIYLANFPTLNTLTPKSDAVVLNFTTPGGWGESSVGPPTAMYTLVTNTIESALITSVSTSWGLTSPSSYTLSSLTPDTQYTIYMKMYNSSTIIAANFLASSNTLITTTGPPQPVLTSSATNITSTGFTISWAALPTATSYTITQTPVAGSYTISGNTATFIGLTANTAYSITLSAKNSAGSSSTPSAVVSYSTGPTAPVLSAATAITTTTFTIAWTGGLGPATLSTAFTVTPAGPTTINTVSPAAFTGATPNTIYSFTAITTSTTAGSSVPSAPLSVTTVPAVPTLVTASNITTTGCTFNWAIAGTAAITSYSFLNGTTPLTATVTGTTATITGLTVNTRHLISMTATNASGTSAASPLLSVTTLPLPMTLNAPVAANIWSTSFVITLTPPATGVGANSYSVFINGQPPVTPAAVAISGTAVVPIATITGLVPNTAYSITATTNNDGGSSAISNAVIVTTVAGGPTGVTVSNIKDRGYTLNWTDPVGIVATSYVVRYSVLNSGVVNTTTISTTGGTTATITGLGVNTPYMTNIVAVYAGGTSDYSTTINFSTAPLPPTLVAPAAATVTQTGFAITWVAPGGTGIITSYNFFANGQPLVAPAAVAITGTTTLTGTFTGLVANTAYSITGTANNASASSAISNAVISTTLPVAPTGVTSSNITQTGFTLNWTIIGNAITSYVFKNSTTVLTATVTGTTATVTGLLANTVYSSITMTAANASGISAASTAISVTTLPNPPTAITITAGTITATGCTLTMAGGTSVAGVVTTLSYTLNGGASTTYTGTTVALTTLTPGENNTFIVSATNAGGTTTATKMLATPPLQPTGLTKTAVSGTGFTLNWTATNGSATTYTITIGGVAVTPSSSGTNSATFSGLTPNTTYSVIVTATANGAASTPSAALSVTTGPAAPAITSFTNVTKTGFTVNWSGGTGSTSYTYTVNGVTATPTSSTATKATFDGYPIGTSLPVIISAVNAIATVSSTPSTVTLMTVQQETASSAQQQADSSARQQADSSAVRQGVSSAQQQVFSGAISIHQQLINEYTALKNAAANINKTVYSTSTAISQADKLAAQQQLMAILSQMAAKKTEIFAEDVQIRAMQSTYQDRDMQPIVPDPAVEAQGYTKRFDMENNKYIYIDLSGNTLQASNAAFLYTRRTGGGKRRITKRAKMPK